MSEIQPQDVTNGPNLTRNIISPSPSLPFCKGAVTMDQRIEGFKSILQEAIDFRETALYSKNSLILLPLNANSEELTQVEQAILKRILNLFNETFGVE